MLSPVNPPYVCQRIQDMLPFYAVAELRISKLTSCSAYSVQRVTCVAIHESYEFVNSQRVALLF